MLYTFLTETTLKSWTGQALLLPSQMASTLAKHNYSFETYTFSSLKKASHGICFGKQLHTEILLNQVNFTYLLMVRKMSCTDYWSFPRDGAIS